LKVEADCLARETLLDPSIWWTRARRERPVFFEPRLNAWLVTRREDVLRVLRDTATFSSLDNLPRSPVERGTRPGPYPWEVPTLANGDPPGHTRIRKIANRAFTRRRLAALDPLIAGEAERLVEAIAPRGESDVVADIAWPLAEYALAESVGYPEGALGTALDAIRAFDVTTDPDAPQHARNDAETAYAAFVELCRSLLALRREHPGDDLITVLASSDATGPEAVSVLFQVTLAGLATSAHLTSHVVRLSLEWGHAARLRHGADAAREIVEETLRHSSPVRAMERTATRPVELGGVSLEEGAPLLVVFGSANRDEDFVAHGDAFCPARSDGRDHVAFGRGVHFCLGAEIARAEARAALRAITALPALELVPDQRYDPFPNVGIFGLRGLLVRWRSPGTS